VFTLVVTDRHGTERRMSFDKHEIIIGRTAGNDIALPLGSISKHHARLVYSGGRYLVVDLKSTNGVYVNGNRIVGPLVVGEGDRIAIAEFTLALLPYEPIVDEPTLEVDVVELRLLASIARSDEGSREVYADWLDEHDDSQRAELVRMQDALVGMSLFEREDHVPRLRELAANTDAHWRIKVARPPIEHCKATSQCPIDWGSLAHTERSDVRTCKACGKQVFFCETLGEARTRADRGELLVLDDFAERTQRRHRSTPSDD
jgi:uncharacterized protein (TIGR02996 family)